MIPEILDTRVNWPPPPEPGCREGMYDIRIGNGPDLAWKTVAVDRKRGLLTLWRIGSREDFWDELREGDAEPGIVVLAVPPKELRVKGVAL